MIDLKIKDKLVNQYVWLHFDSFNEAIPTIKSALITGYEVIIDKAEKE